MRQLWCYGAIVRGITLVWGVLGLDCSGVLKLVDHLLSISWHEDVQYACLVFPVQCDATVKTPSPILCDLIFFMECIYEVHCVIFSLVFYPKVVNH